MLFILRGDPQRLFVSLYIALNITTLIGIKEPADQLGELRKVAGILISESRFLSVVGSHAASD